LYCACTSSSGGDGDYIVVVVVGAAAAAIVDDENGDVIGALMWFSTDSDQQCGGEMAHSTSEELTADQQRLCISERQTSDIAKLDKSHEMRDVPSESSSGENSDPRFVR